MALATQCPHCGTMFRVAADQLKLRGGIVRCGACTEVFDGNAALVDLASAARPSPPLRRRATDGADAIAPPAAPSSPAASPPAPPAAPVAEADDDPIYTLEFDRTFAPHGILPRLSSDADEAQAGHQAPAQAPEAAADGHDAPRDVAAAVAPDVVPDVVPDVLPAVVPDLAPEVASEAADFAPEAAPELAPGVSNADFTEDATEDATEDSTEVAAEAVTEGAHEDATEDATRLAPELAPELATEAPEAAPEPVPAAIASAAAPAADLQADEALSAAAAPHEEQQPAAAPARAPAPAASARDGAGAPALLLRESGPATVTMPAPPSAPPLAPSTPRARAAQARAARKSKLTPTRIEPPKLRVPEPDEPEFVRRGRQRERSGKAMRIAMAIGSVVLLLALAAQIVINFSTPLAARYPALKPALVSLCGALGCRVALPARIDQLVIDTGELTTLGGNAYAYTTQLRNQGDATQAWPSIELTLSDADDKPLVRRVFGPRDYLPAGPLPALGFAAHAEQPVKLHFRVAEPAPSGYHVAVFYP